MQSMKNYHFRIQKSYSAFVEIEAKNALEARTKLVEDVVLREDLDWQDDGEGQFIALGSQWRQDISDFPDVIINKT